MTKTVRISKISIRSTKEETEYADTGAVTEAILTLSAKHHLPLGKYVQDLLDANVDSISVTKDKPYCYFFARRFDQNISISIKEEDKIIDFSIPTVEAEKLTVLNWTRD